LVQYGHALKESGDINAAVEAYRASLQFDPASADTHLQLGHALKLQGRRDAATGAYLTAIALDATCKPAQNELLVFGWSIDDITAGALLEAQWRGDVGVIAVNDRHQPQVTIRSPTRWADVACQATVVIETGPPSTALNLVASWRLVSMREGGGNCSGLVAVTPMQAQDPAGCMWAARAPLPLARGAYLVEISHAQTGDVLAITGIQIIDDRLARDATPEIVAPADWAVTGAHPVVEIRYRDIADIEVGFVAWQAFNAAENFAPPLCSVQAKYDPVTGLHRAVSPLALADGPHVITIRNNDHKIVAERGIHVDEYLELRHDYNAWTKNQFQLYTDELSELRKHISVMTIKPNFSIMLEHYAGLSAQPTIASIEAQMYPHWTMNEATSEYWPLSSEQSSGDYIVVVRAGDILHPAALYEFANRLNMHPNLDLIYADEDRLRPDGIYDQPFHKPGWSPDYLETFNYVGYPACFRRHSDINEMFGAGYYGFVLKFTERHQNIASIRKVLCHRSETSLASNPVEKAIECAALTARLARTGRDGVVRPLANYSVGNEVRINRRTMPLVSIVIPTAGKKIQHRGKTLDFLLNCLTGINLQSTYRNFEIIIVDNGDLEDAQKQEVERLGCRLITFDEPVFNVARKLNIGAAAATGEYLLLMNDDIEIISPDWIERLLEHFEKPHVGVVGAKLCYPDDSLQHAGVVHNFGNPDHVSRNAGRSAAGYFASINGVHNYSAVTGAVMMARREIYQAVGGYTEFLAESFNDVDFCQKVRKLGLTIVYTPHAELIHFESQSRIPRLVMAELDYYQSQWAHEVCVDPFYNEQCLEIAPPTFVPVVNKPVL
ncbi:MAG: glycosyltransferase, partial [Acetobacteraceae bacterium]|nr:glycosyltransferase [Acetobacteraceae bacterium]